GGGHGSTRTGCQLELEIGKQTGDVPGVEVGGSGLRAGYQAVRAEGDHEEREALARSRALQQFHEEGLSIGPLAVAVRPGGARMRSSLRIHRCHRTSPTTTLIMLAGIQVISPPI